MWASLHSWLVSIHKSEPEEIYFHSPIQSVFKWDCDVRIIENNIWHKNLVSICLHWEIVAFSCHLSSASLINYSNSYLQRLGYGTLDSSPVLAKLLNTADILLQEAIYGKILYPETIRLLHIFLKWEATYLPAVNVKNCNSLNLFRSFLNGSLDFISQLHHSLLSGRAKCFCITWRLDRRSKLFFQLYCIKHQAIISAAIPYR